MHYWNQDNFEGLKAVGEKYALINGFELYADYCLLKEQGLKKHAMSAINAFVSFLQKRHQEEQRAAAVELASLAFENKETHQLLPYPLVQCLKHILERWVSEDEKNPLPYKWLGYIAADYSYFEKTLQLDPNDEMCLSKLAVAHLNDIDYQTHHLSESLLIGTLSDAKSSLDHAQVLIDRIKTKALKMYLQSDYAYYEKLLNCWEMYSKAEQKESFPDWCAFRGEEFNFWSIMYYK
ncbi:hypothetical protein [Marinicella sp. W31]|uniref:hypothetical protein n=1 Tax=Marinicella sp. W31 TaxID=3023713 RepID=UPI003757AEA2